MSNQLEFLLKKLDQHEQRAATSFNLTPSENRLSPLASLPFLLDGYNRYFLDDLRLFGRWCFPGGQFLGDIEQQVLLPVLRELAKAEFANVRPISGINCMTILLAALTVPGDRILTVPVSAGGHVSTAVVAKRLGAEINEIPFLSPHEIDFAALKVSLRKSAPKLIYLDQSTFLVPIDPWEIRKLVDEFSPSTIIHFDSSHTNGLILGGALPNPLERGAHSFGGSTHKTLPGPHKGFIATNSQALAKAIEEVSDHFVSQHKMAEVISLAVTLLELRDCGGAIYAVRTIENARQFAAELARLGAPVAVHKGGHTECHQVWISADHERLELQKGCMLEQGIVANSFPGLPGMSGPGYRVSLAEFTRMGAQRDDAVRLARAFAALLKEDLRHAADMREMRERLSRVKYCYDPLGFLKSGGPLSMAAEGILAPLRGAC